MGPSGESPNKVAVVRFLKTKANGATTAEIVRHILTDPPSDLAVTKNRNSIYNLLARMRKDEELVRRGDRYYLPRPKDEAPDPEGSSASTVHRDAGRGDPVSTSGNGSHQLFAALPGASPAEPGQ